VTPPQPTDDRTYLRAFGRRVKVLRVGADLTQEQLAELAGLSRQYLGLLERGEQSIDLLRLRRLATALGVDLSALLDVRVG
jgi:transcriptional regulator with XRE-family HTH domain